MSRVIAWPLKWLRGMPRFIAAAAGALIVAVLVLLSPFALREISDAARLNWSLLGDVGDTYGAVAALLSAAALVALMASIALQAREVRHSREQAARAIQHDLIRMALEEPLYLQCIGIPETVTATSDENRQDMYLNLLVNFWQMRWEFKDMSEVEVRAAGSGNLFSTDIGRRYWRKYGDARLSYVKSARAQEFNRILGQEYEHSIAGGPPRLPASATGAVRSRGDCVRAVSVGAGLVAVVAVAGTVGWRVLTRSMPPSR